MKKLKIPYLNVLPILVIAFLLFKLIDNMELSLGGIFKTLYGCVAYFVAGLVVAYLLNPAMTFFEKWITSAKDSQRTKHIKRGSVIGFIYLLLIGFVTIFIVAIVPGIRDGIEEITLRLPGYTNSVENWFANLPGKMDPSIYHLIENWAEDFLQFVYKWLNGLDFSSISGAVTTGVSSVATAAIRFGFGIVISVYFLYNKEGLIVSLKKLVYALFGQKRGDSVIETGRKINNIFINYIVGKFLQSLIFFLVGLAVLVPLRIPLAPLLALFMAIMNMIPYFGPFVGGVFSVLLVLFYSPVKALWVLLYAVGIQILDNILIGPKIMSEQVGISPLLVILGVTLGGTFGGILGLFIGVPLVAIVKLVFYDPFIERKLKEKEIDLHSTTK